MSSVSSFYHLSNVGSFRKAKIKKKCKRRGLKKVVVEALKRFPNFISNRGKVLSNTNLHLFLKINLILHNLVVSLFFLNSII